MAPLCINYRTKDLQYQREINQILESELPAIMPMFNKSRVDPNNMEDTKGLKVLLLEYCLIERMLFINHKKNIQLFKSRMKKLLTKQKIDEGKITAFRR